MFDIVAKDNYDYSKPFYKAKGIEHVPYEQNEKLKTYVRSMAKQTVGEYINLTQHTAFAVFDKGGKTIAPLFESNKNKVATSLSDTYTKLVDYAVTKAQLGETSYQSAVCEIVDAMAKSGIRTVDYATGYSRRLDTAIRQNVLWGIKECNQNVADFVGEEFGADGYEISYHSHPRETHADMAGKQFAIGKARTVNGVYYPSFEEEAEPLLREFGCLHFKYPILLGISRPAYSKEQLEELKSDDNRTFEFEGETYTLYKGTQMQRDIETAIRHHKDLAITAKEVGAEDLQRQVQYEINQLTNKYAELSKASGLPTKIERMQVKGFRSVKTEKTLTEKGKSSIIELNRLSAPQKFKPMDRDRRERIFEGLRRQGADIILGKEAEAYLDYKDGQEGGYHEAASLGNVMLFRDNPSASAVFEETIHFNQNKRMRVNSETVDDMEIEAAEKMIKYQKAYGITDEEIEYTKKRLRILKEGEL